MSHSSSASAEKTYQLRAEKFEGQQLELEKQAYWVSWGRVASFLAAAGCIVMGWPQGGWQHGAPAMLWLVFAGLLSILFFALVSWTGRLRKLEDRFAGLTTINRHALARLQRLWDHFPVPVVDSPVGAETVSRDLDLFGHASLFQLVCTAHTSLGRQRLRDWLVQPAEPKTITQRQAAVACMVPELELRQEMELLGQQAAKGQADVNRFSAWAESEPWLARQRGLILAARILPMGTLLLLALGIFQVVPMSLWVLPVILGMILSFTYCGKIHSFFNLISTRRDEIRSYSDLFSLATLLPDPCHELQRIQKQLSDEGNPPHQRLTQLGRIMDLANFRYSPMVYMVVQPLTMWDFHVLGLAESWQRRSGGKVRGWFEALADLESLASLASLAHAHPDWSMPQVTAHDQSQPIRFSDSEVRASGSKVRASGLGHPLLPDQTRVANDVTVGPAGTLLLVTGSNMSGKSTLLRSLGTNVALAQAGGPVCASHLALPPVVLATSMRIDDSLEQGVSFFMAELKRLKEIVDLADQHHVGPLGVKQQDENHHNGGSAQTVLYLLDEILLGTNSAERHIAVERVLGHLLRQGAIGAITTHDLELADSPILKGSCQTVHFRESFVSENGIQQMKFDYQLHPGVATTRNALKLLEMVGLNDTRTESGKRKTEKYQSPS